MFLRAGAMLTTTSQQLKMVFLTNANVTWRVHERVYYWKHILCWRTALVFFFSITTFLSLTTLWRQFRDFVIAIFQTNQTVELQVETFWILLPIQKFAGVLVWVETHWKHSVKARVVQHMHTICPWSVVRLFDINNNSAAFTTRRCRKNAFALFRVVITTRSVVIVHVVHYSRQ